jgi:ribosomal protein L11 methyltransferase
LTPRRGTPIFPAVPHSDEAWTAVRVELPDDAADAVANFLFEYGVSALVSDDDAAPAPPGKQRLEAHVRPAEAAELTSALQTYAEALARLDARLAPIVIHTQPVAATDWDGVFRAHHRPTPIGTRLLVAPPWDVPAATGREVLVVEPGMAFGTGQHATTRACLEEVEAAIEAGVAARVLDVGTGTGILAAAAARLGARSIVALDADPAVVPLARDTLVRNGAARVHLLAGTAASVRGAFDLVLANLLAGVLIDDAALLAARVRPGGRLVVSGILADQVEGVVAAYPAFAVTGTRPEGAWRTLRLERTAS